MIAYAILGADPDAKRYYKLQICTWIFGRAIQGKTQDLTTDPTNKINI
jgi:hypothetical protein